MRRARAISFSPFQNSSSKLTLVLCRAMTTDRLMTVDFMVAPFVHAMRVQLTIAAAVAAVVLAGRVTSKLLCTHFYGF